MGSRQKLAGAALVAVIALVSTWEGLRTKSYQDVIGVWTICYGYTHGVRPGQVAEPAACEALLMRELRDVHDKVSRCVRTDLTAGERAALVSLAYNVGVAAVCRSTMVRLLNQGRPREACYQLRRWVYAGGSREPLPGLVNRREAELRVCLGAAA